MESGITYGDFFRNAPAPNPNRKLITGSICGVKVETIEDPLMQEIRYLDKLVDELAKGKAMEKVLRKIRQSKRDGTRLSHPFFYVLGQPGTGNITFPDPTKMRSHFSENAIFFLDIFK